MILKLIISQKAMLRSIRLIYKPLSDQEPFQAKTKEFQGEILSQIRQGMLIVDACERFRIIKETIGEVNEYRLQSNVREHK